MTLHASDGRQSCLQPQQHTNKALRNVEGIGSNGIKDNSNLCIPQAVLDVIIVSGQ